MLLKTFSEKTVNGVLKRGSDGRDGEREVFWKLGGSSASGGIKDAAERH
jgi:hypothetical protein